MRARVVSAEGWVIAESGRLEPGKSEEDIAAGPSRRRWFESLVYRNLIAPGMTGAGDFADEPTAARRAGSLAGAVRRRRDRLASGADRGSGRAGGGGAAAIGCP